ncbi:MAG: TetR/AcrR family transcriptional regulator [Treponema sp.]|nr:TetR/AcrR family transcriptional regulator [Treponema sp.]
MDLFSTRGRILSAAVELFSDYGYDKVSMRKIAGAMGIRAASIYNHFSSKADILKSLYDFYAKEQQLVIPSLDNLLQLAETTPLQTVFLKLILHFPPDIQKTMDRIFFIASQRINVDTESENFIRKYFFESRVSLLIPLLKKMIESGKIESVNIDDFICLFAYYSFSAAVLNNSNLRMDPDQWRCGFNMIFSLLKIMPDATDIVFPVS